MRPIPVLIFAFLCMLALSGCQQPAGCQDPLGCARYQSAQPIKIGIVTPRTDAHTCPQAAESVRAIQAVFADQSIIGRPFSITVEDSGSDPVTAQQRMNDLAEDPATAGLFYLDCASDPGPVAQTAADAGLPGFVYRLPDARERVYAILPSVETQAERLLWLLDGEIEGSLLVAVDPLDGSEELSSQICLRWREQNGGCAVETFTDDLPAAFAAGGPAAPADSLLVLSSRADSLARDGEPQAGLHTVFWFNPYSGPSPDARTQAENAAGAGASDPLIRSTVDQSTGFTVQAAGALLEAVRSAAYEENHILYLPHQAVLEHLDQTFAECLPETGPTCADSFDYTLYPFRDGILIINP